MNLNQWFEKAITAEEYINSMNKNKEGLLHIYNQFHTPDDESFFQRIKNKNLRVVVLTEDWCGDAMLNVPILLRLAENSNIEVRMLYRDQNLELMDQYLTNGKSRSIPIFIFINDQGEEVAKWGSRAEIVQQFVDESRSKLPTQDAPDYEEKAKALYQNMNQTFIKNRDFWNEVYQSIKQVL